MPRAVLNVVDSPTISLGAKRNANDGRHIIATDTEELSRVILGSCLVPSELSPTTVASELEAGARAELAHQHALQLVQAFQEFARFSSRTATDAQRQPSYRGLLAPFHAVAAMRTTDIRLHEGLAACCFLVARVGIEVLRSRSGRSG